MSDRLRISLLVTATSLALGACTAGAAPPPQPESAGGPAGSPNILIITVDTLRADHLGTYGYWRPTSPNIDAWAKETVLWEKAVTPMATTLPAHVSIMTGTYPLEHRVTRNGIRFQPKANLRPVAAVLREAGYETVAFVSASPVNPGTGIEKGFDHFDHPPRKVSRRGEITTRRVLQWLKKRKSDKPLFMWIHYWDPHDPYEPPKDHLSLFRHGDDLKAWLAKVNAPLTKKIGRVTFDVQDVHNRYDGEIHYLDSEVGKLFDGLRSMKLYDALTIALTSDHGEGLWQHNWHDHGRIWNEEIFVPLMIKPPKGSAVKPRRMKHMVSTVDVLPTLDAIVDIPWPDSFAAQMSGVNALQDKKRQVLTERVHVRRTGWEPGRKYSLTGDTWKYFMLTRGKDQLYKISDDWFEQKDVADEHPEVSRTMKETITAVMARQASRASGKPPQVNKQLMEKLRSLGYME